MFLEIILSIVILLLQLLFVICTSIHYIIAII